MKMPKRLKDFLDKKGFLYQVMKHPKVYTSQELAALEHVPGREVAKVVMVKADERDVMVVIPASGSLDFIKLSIRLGTNNIRLAQEHEFRNLFPDCEVGAMPPMGHLYGLPCFMDQALIEDEEIVFSGGTHSATVKMSIKDFQRVADPDIGDFCVQHGVNIGK